MQYCTDEGGSTLKGNHSINSASTTGATAVQHRPTSGTSAKRKLQASDSKTSARL